MSLELSLKQKGNMSNQYDDIASLDYKRDFSDRTCHIVELEEISDVIFLCPDDANESSFSYMLRNYYDLNYSEQFEELFGDTWVGQNPTGRQNKYIVLLFDFSGLPPSLPLEESIGRVEARFKQMLKSLRSEYAPILDELAEFSSSSSVLDDLDIFLTQVWLNGCPQIYAIVREYDQLASQVVVNKEAAPYEQFAHDSFLKTLFATLKAGRDNGAIANIFVTGSAPVLFNDLAFSFNITPFLTSRDKFDQMLGYA